MADTKSSSMSGAADLEDAPPPVDHASIVNHLRLPLLVFVGTRVVYRNRAADRLSQWLREQYSADLVTVLRDHVSQIRSAGAPGDTLTLVRLPEGGRLFIDVSPLESRHRVVTVRAPGIELEAIGHHYRLTPRERRVVEYVIRGMSNQAIASLMQVRVETIKKHLTSVFAKLGVESRTQLVSLIG